MTGYLTEYWYWPLLNGWARFKESFKEDRAEYRRVRFQEKCDHEWVEKEHGRSPYSHSDGRLLYTHRCRMCNDVNWMELD